MPKVKFTKAKGLYQESGSGVDLTSDSADVHIRRPVVSVSAATTLSESQSGAIINVGNTSGASIVIKMPQDPAVGTTYCFTNTVALSASSGVDLDAKDGEEFFVGTVFDYEGAATPASITFNGTSHDQLKLAALAGANHFYICVTFIGTNKWLIHDAWTMDASDISAGAASSNA